MNKNIEIKFIKNNAIDFQKWDSCIENSSNRKVYAFSWFLDIVAKNWDALVFGDYEFCMPLPYNKKFGFTYVYQPFFCQQLGVFPNPTPGILQQFELALAKQYKYVDYTFNASHEPNPGSPFLWKEKTNLVIPLIHDYASLANDYSKHTKRNLKNAKAAKVEVVMGLRAIDYLNTKSENLKTKVPPQSVDALGKLLRNTITSGSGVVYAAYSDVNNLCAAAFFLFDGNRAYYINAFSTEEGRENRAMYPIVDTFIEEYAGSGRILDFEGSTIEGVARFYKGFGALQEKYYHIHYNKLPLPFRWLKK